MANQAVQKGRFLGLEWIEWRFWLSWVLVTTVGFGVGQAVVEAVGVAMPMAAAFVSAFVGGAVLGAITGLALIMLLRRPIQRVRDQEQGKSIDQGGNDN